MNVLEIGRGWLGSVGLAEDVDKWRALIMVAMNLRVP
jgi:hypothetical protein